MKRIIIFFTIISSVFAVSAKQIGVSEAQKVADRFLRSNSRLAANGDASVQLAHVLNEDGQNRLYVFNASHGGFVIVSGCDGTEQVLGYSDSGSFDPQNVAPGLDDMLQYYSEEIGYAIDNDLQRAPGYVQTADARPTIAPMLSTRWGQSTPFNNLCPMVGSNRSVTGCLATAMAQVMKYHNWPEVGEGSRSYDATLGGTTMTLGVDFGETTYDWANMLDYYGAGYNETQANAVATLLYSCGVSCGMNYASSTAPSAELFKALPNYFKYDKSIKMAERAYYGIDEWNDLVYNELRSGRVVYLAGYNAMSGHAFVCDGYDKNDYFHINWGWVGLDDGYFKMSALDPSEQGIGGSDAGYSKGLEMVYNIKKDEGGEAGIEIGFHGDCSINRGTADLGSMTELVFGVTGMTSFSIFKDYYYMRLGIMAVNEETGEETFAQSNNIYWCILSSYYYSLADKNIRVYANTLGGLPDGNYRLYPAVWDISHNLYAKGRVYPGKIPYVIMKKEGNNATFKHPTVEKPILNATVTQNTQFYKNYRYSVTATVTNRGGDYCQYIYPALMDENLIEVHRGEGLIYELRNGESMTQEHITMLPSTIEAGTYYLVMVDCDGNMINWPEEVTVKENTGSYSLRATGFNITNADNVNAANVEMTVRVTCMSGYFNGVLDAYIHRMGGTSLCRGSSAFFDLTAGQSRDVTFSVPFKNAVVGMSYQAAIFDYNVTPCTMLTSFLTFTVGSISGIDGVTAYTGNAIIYPNPVGDVMRVAADGSLTGVEVYSLSGSKVMAEACEGHSRVAEIDVSALAPGIYVVKVHSGGKCHSLRMVKQ